MSAPHPASATTRQSIDGWTRARRRGLVVIALLSYPLLVAAWLGLPAAGVTGIPWAIAVLAASGLMLLSNYGLYAFRRSMAQAPDADLDERQVAVRDRAYLEAYRIFAAIMLLGLLIVGILPDAIDRPLDVTYETVQPFLLGAILYSIILPSAVVAWGEPDLDEA